MDKHVFKFLCFLGGAGMVWFYAWVFNPEFTSGTIWFFAGIFGNITADLAWLEEKDK